MLLRLTNACNEMCPHCLVDATPDGMHMSVDVFKNVCAFLLRTGTRSISVSGGEPTLHPQFLDMMQDLIRVKDIMVDSGVVILITNGTWILDTTMTCNIKKLLRQGVQVQVSTQKEFYKNHDMIMSHEKCFVQMGCEFCHDSIEQLVRIGRCKPDAFSKFPVTPSTCANIALTARQLQYNKWLPTLELRGNFCKPSINVDGSISAGESPLCTPLGTVMNTVQALHTAAVNHNPRNCNRCSGWDPLRRRHATAAEFFTGRKFPQDPCGS